MMIKFIIQEVYERRWLLGVTSVLLLLWSIFIVSLYPVLSQLQPSNPVIENMPVLFEGFLGELSYLREFPTFLASQLFTIHLPLALGGVAIMYGWSVSGAAEHRGEFRTNLARPMSRTTLVVSRWLLLVIMMTICMLLIMTGLYAVLPLIEGETAVGLSTYLRLMLMGWLYVCAVGTIAFAIGVCFARRTLTVLVGLAVVMVGYYATIIGPVLASAAELRHFSLLEYVAAVDVVQRGIVVADAGVFIAVIFGVLGVAAVALNGRDIVR